MTRTLAAGAVAAALLAPAPARAEDRAGAAPAPPPDPAAVEAGEANLEPIERRGIVFTVALGGGLSIGLGMDNATGQGGAGTLRVGHVANARTVVAAEFIGSALFFGVSGELYRTDVQNLVISGQRYISPALWVRAGVGFGRYAGNELRMGDAIFRERFRLAGPVGSAGAGVDVLRFRRVRASLEVCSTAMFNREGVMASNAFLLGLSFD
ncbi:MAG TPA: hypothetical protein VK932_17960 [Kofleriaceae bacterium]|nr:hypothetical protein [Kofleriaceae bacterium]